MATGEVVLFWRNPTSDPDQDGEQVVTTTSTPATSRWCTSEDPLWPSGTFLSELPQGIRRNMLDLGIRDRFAPGERLMRENERDTHLVLLLSGLVKVTSCLGNGHEALLGIRVPGDVVGEMAALEETPRSATVTACSGTEVRVVSSAELRLFLVHHPEAAVTIYRTCARRLRRANRWRLEFGGFPVKVRLARALVELATAHGRKGWRGVIVGVDLSQSELAALIGSTKETVHKALAELRRDGVIETRCQYMTVHEERLRRVAQLERGAS
ncbi:Crp/Fnr family transcriptional regulator [Streptomyces sp. NPDC048636]|uniref:Crp/Fnr family transcriptional regulator n=1 Tax=Streptomyces sp. NPDC048636 TaxID=3155762 RepID=UPI00344AFD8F